jgi:integrase/recombinase XerD
MAKSNDKNPLSHTLLRTKQDLQLTGTGDRTQESYVRAVRKFSEFLKREPDTATEDDLRKYLLYIKNDRQWSQSTLNVAYCGLKFFFSKTCPREWPTLKMLKVQQELKLPTILSVEEVQILLRLIDKPSMICFFTVVYSLGLRLNEALNLEVSDIDSKRMLVHVHRGKGNRDRLIPLPVSTLHVLRSYYASHKNPKLIFPTEGKNHGLASTATVPMSESSVQGCIAKVVKQLRWDDRGITTHTLRHCYATHLLEAGINLRLIQKYMGHAYLTATMIYLHVTTIGEESAISKINNIMKRNP